MPAGYPAGMFHFTRLSTVRIAFLILILALPLGGCTTRSDKEKNKDYDKPRDVQKDAK